MIKTRPAAPHTRGECDWCGWPMRQGDRVEWNGGTGHGYCVARMQVLVRGDDEVGETVRDFLEQEQRHLEAEAQRDRLVRFLARLYDEAEAVGIDIGQLTLAMRRALAIDAREQRRAA